MAKRSTPTSKRDDDAFPIRVKFKVPRDGLGETLNEMHHWLRENVPAGQWAKHSARTIGGSALAVYFVRIEDAAEFIEAFPQVEFAHAYCCAKP